MPRGLRAKAGAVAGAAGLRRVRRQKARVDSLETAVRENTLLGLELADVVGRIEIQLVPILEGLETTEM